MGARSSEMKLASRSRGLKRAEALKAIQELGRSDPAVMDDWSGWSLDIADRTGRLLLSVPLDAAPFQVLSLSLLTAGMSTQLLQHVADMLPNTMAVAASNFA